MGVWHTSYIRFALRGNNEPNGQIERPKLEPGMEFGRHCGGSMTTRNASARAPILLAAVKSHNDVFL